MLDYRTETFLVLYEEMNYRRTAARLNITQPGVSQHIRFLEKYYGVKLFLYNGRSLTRTRAAETLKRHLDHMRAEEQAMCTELIPSDVLTLRIGATKTIGEFVIVPQIRTFLSNPSHRLELVVDNTKALLGLLEKTRLDFAVIEGTFDKSRYGYRLFQKEDFVGVCAKTHPFAGKSVSLSDVFRENLVVREPDSGTRKLLEQAIGDKGFSLEHFARTSSVSNFSVICDLVALDHAITFAYAPVANSRENLSTFTVEDLQIKGEFNFVYLNEAVAEEKIRHIFR